MKEMKTHGTISVFTRVYEPGGMIVAAIDRVAWNAALCLSDLCPDLSIKWGKMQASSCSCAGAPLFFMTRNTSVTRVRMRRRPAAVSRKLSAYAAYLLHSAMLYHIKLHDAMTCNVMLYYEM